jgi:EAL domain-containing protein (putative c-di-GMP-specific phosphodiesterase class I)/GGDEF domain-containing protein
VEVASTTAFAYDELWKSSVRAAMALAAVGLLAGVIGTVVLRRIGRALDATVRQAAALTQGEFVSVREPRVPELARLTKAMNSMVARMKASFDVQSNELHQLHLLAHLDPLTELSNRGFFLRQLRTALEREDGPAHGGLVLLRLADLAGLNQTLGREKADRLIKQVALGLRPYGERVDGCFAGRLNGADFALYVPVSGMVLETAQTLMQILSNSLASQYANVTVAAGALEVRHGMSITQVMADVDAALARAEGAGGFNVHLGTEHGGLLADAAGEGAWRERLGEALLHGRAKLVSFPLINAEQNLIHLETPLRLQLDKGGDYEVAANWLPLASRSRLTAAVDQRAVALALDGITEDGLPRCVNVSAASLADSGFASRLRALMFGGPQAARRLWIEVPESAAIEHFALLQELGRQLRPCGVKIGLEHVSARLRQVDRLLELGLDFIKLDSSAIDGLAGDPTRAQFVRGMVVMLHGLSITVFAEGVTQADDARVLWSCGVDGITGPVASERRRDLVQS